ncbi:MULTISPECIES: hypothetical protein [unclassified Aeromicrobium]|uniref:hypothetical protein n=1 Tax=unclassified Aeromicrobium TaxID=2633570 RepID=UPI00288C3DAC|nr:MULTISPECIES: hypothetical protein [unclassified Aeromicrobium]
MGDIGGSSPPRIEIERGRSSRCGDVGRPCDGRWRRACRFERDDRLDVDLRWRPGCVRFRPSGRRGILDREPRRTARKQRRNLPHRFVVVDVDEREEPTSGAHHMRHHHLTDRHQVARVVQGIAGDAVDPDLDAHARVRLDDGAVAPHVSDTDQHCVSRRVVLERFGGGAYLVAHVEQTVGRDPLARDLLTRSHDPFDRNPRDCKLLAKRCSAEVALDDASTSQHPDDTSRDGSALHGPPFEQTGLERSLHGVGLEQSLDPCALVRAEAQVEP